MAMSFTLTWKFCNPPQRRASVLLCEAGASHSHGGTAMINAMSRPFETMGALRPVLIALLLVISSAQVAQSSSDVAIVDNVTIYYAVLPAEMLRSFAPGSEEARMHGGVPGGAHVHHVQIALFDATTGARITDAIVTVEVAEISLGGFERDLEPFQIGDALTYGGYFEFQNRDLYQIRMRATLPDGTRVIETTFEYRHR